MHYYAVNLWQHKTFSGTVFCGNAAGNAGNCILKKQSERLGVAFYVNLTAALGMPKATCARAVQQLKSLGIVSSISEGTANFITAGPGKIDINAAFPHITSPV